MNVRNHLGHKNVLSAEICIVLARTIFWDSSADESILKVASTLEEFTKLLEVSFDYVDDYEDKGVVEKRKQSAITSESQRGSVTLSVVQAVS